MILKWYHYIICGVIVILGLFCTMNLVELFSIESKEYGTAITLEKQNDYTEIAKFDLGSIVFESEDYINFELTESYAPIEFNGDGKDYILLFNDQPLNNIECTNGRISGELSIVYYNLDGQEIAQSEVFVEIDFFAGETKLKLTSTNCADSIAYLTAYTNINGAVIKVVDRG